MSFFMQVVAERVNPDSTLQKVDALMDWQRPLEFMLSVGRSVL